MMTTRREPRNVEQAFPLSKADPSPPSGTGVQSGQETVHRPVRFRLLWLLAFLVLLGSNPRAPVESVRIVDPPADAVLAPERAWSSPLSKLPVVEPFSEWPYWLFAAVGAVLIALVSRPMTRGIFPSMSLLFGLSLTMQPHHLIPAALLCGVVLTTRSGFWLNHRKSLAAAVGCWAAGGLLITVEFGFVLLVSAALLLSLSRPAPLPGGLDRRWGLILSGALAVGLLGAVTAFSSGFPWTLVRPLSWIWLVPPEGLLPSLSSPLRRENIEWPKMLLILSLAICWWGVLKKGKAAAPVWLMFFLSLLGLGSARYLWLSTIAVALLVREASTLNANSAGRDSTSPSTGSRSTVKRRGPDWSNRIVLGACLVFACAWLGRNFADYREFVLTGKIPPRLVDPVQWGTSGRVMLTNLDHAPDWQSAASRQRFSLLLDDRWDAVADRLLDYAALCRDLFEVRNDSYLRDDGEFGGYTLRLEEWNPALLVVDSSDLDAIRSLSLSPHWTAMGVDRRRTIFGSPDERRNFAQLRQASQALTNLEWPGQVSAPPNPEVLVAESDSDKRRVAEVLCALRLPYAGLRILPDDEAWNTERIRTWCYLELAHRHRRYSGRGSLLDQYRALVGVRRGQVNKRWSAKERTRIAHSLEGLGLPAPVIGALTGHTSRLPSGSRGSLPAARDMDEAPLLQALAAGDGTVARKLTRRLEEPASRFYAMLASSTEKSARESYQELTRLVEELPDRLRGEALFYVGCLAIEVGDSQGAVDAFLRSARTEPASPFAPLRQTYLRQLSSR